MLSLVWNSSLIMVALIDPSSWTQTSRCQTSGLGLVEPGDCGCSASLIPEVVIPVASRVNPAGYIASILLVVAPVA